MKVYFVETSYNMGTRIDYVLSDPYASIESIFNSRKYAFLKDLWEHEDSQEMYYNIVGWKADNDLATYEIIMKKVIE